MKEPLEWLLLTDEAMADDAAARRRVGHYGRRPRVGRNPANTQPDGRVRQARPAPALGERGIDLARALGARRSTIGRIRHGVRQRAR